MGFQVEDSNGGVRAIGDEAAPGAGNDSHAVVAFLAGDVGHGFAGASVENHRVCRAWNIEEFVLGIDGQVVPAAFASNMKSLGDMIGA